MPEQKVVQGAVGAVRGQAGGVRLLLVLLLLVVTVAAGVYFLAPSLLSTDTPVVKVRPQKARKMKVPARPKPLVLVEEVKEKQLDKEQLDKEQLDKEPLDKEPLDKEPLDKEPLDKEPLDKEPIAAVVPPPVVPPASPQVASEPPVLKPQPEPLYRLSSGSYVSAGLLARTIARIEKMGYQVELSKSSESRQMTRLRVGSYAKAEAQEWLAEIKRLSDGAFIVAEAEKYTVYAGSFLSLDKARRTADLLYQQGVRVEERKIQIELPQTTVYFGQFVSRAAAQKVASALTQQGIKAPQIQELR